MLAQLLRDVVLQVSGHEELEALVVDGLRGREHRAGKVNAITEETGSHQPQEDDGRSVGFVTRTRCDKCDEAFPFNLNLPCNERVEVT